MICNSDSTCMSDIIQTVNSSLLFLFITQWMFDLLYSFIAYLSYINNLMLYKAQTNSTTPNMLTPEGVCN